MRFLTDGQASPTGTHGAPTQLAVTTCTPGGIEEQQAAEAEGGGQKADEGTRRALAMRCPPVGPALPARSTVPPLPTLQKLGRNSVLAMSAHGSAPCLPAAPRKALGVGGVLQMRRQQQNRAPASVTSQNSENEKAKRFGSQNP